MTRSGGAIWVALLALALSACAKAPLASVPAPEREAIAARLLTDIETLSSNAYGGRRPGTDGERLTVDYITGHMQAAGLVSGTNDPGSAWRAPVQLVSTTPRESTISFTVGRRKIAVEEGEGAAFASGSRELVEGADLVFVGKEGDSIAPEDIAGKVAVMLGEPGVSPRRRATLFEAGPAAIITVVEDEDGVANVNRAYGRERILLASEEQSRLTAFTTDKVMREVLGEDRWNLMLDAAEDENFVPIPLTAKASIDAASTRREFTSSNVLGMIPGEVRGAGAVLLLAHWDHLGECAPETPDPICNGAIDNASGIAVMLELARRLKAGGPYDRDIYFLATSAEESGLLGAKAFVEEPPMPLDSIVAAFNFDTVAVAPAGSAVGFVGEGRTQLDPVILDVMAQAGRQLGNREFAESFVRRQDGWALLEEGVPAVFLSTAFGSEIVLGPFLSEDYHRPTDDVGRIELGGAIDDLLLHEELIRRFASISAYPPPTR